MGTATEVLIHMLAPAPWINSNDRLHYRRKMQYTRAWRRAAREAAPDVHFAGRVHITVTVYKTQNRQYDAGNLYPTAKAIVDGLRDAGVLDEDDNAHVIGPDMRAADELRPHACVLVHIRLEKPPRPGGP